MPTVPTLQGQRVTSTQVPSVRASGSTDPYAFGAGASESFDRQMQLFSNLQDQADRTLVTDKVNQLYDFEQTRINDVENGLASKQGIDAISMRESIYADYDKLVGDISKSMSPSQQKLFKDQSERMRRNIQSNVENYVGKQIMVVEKATNEATLSAARSAAINSYSDPSRVDQEIAIVENTLRNQYQYLGKKVQDEIVRKEIGSLGEQMTSSAIGDGDTQTAELYMKRFGKDMKPDVRTRLQEAIKDTDFRVDAQFNTDLFFNGHDDEASALDDARKKLSGKLRDEVVSRLKVRYSEKEQFERQEMAKQFSEDLKLIEDSGGKLDVIPSDRFLSYDTDKRDALRKTASKFITPVTDMESAAVYVRFSELNAESVAQISSDDLNTKILPYVNDKYRLKIVSKWEDARELQSNPDSDNPIEVFSNAQIINQTIREYIYNNATAKEISENKEIQTVASKFTIDAEKELVRLGKKATPDEKRAAMIHIVQKYQNTPIYVDNPWYRDVKEFALNHSPLRLFNNFDTTNQSLQTITKSQIPTATVRYSDIPKNERDQISLRLAQVYPGLSASEVRELAGRFYAASLLKDHNLAQKILTGQYPVE